MDAKKQNVSNRSRVSFTDAAKRDVDIHNRQTPTQALSTLNDLNDSLLTRNNELELILEQQNDVIKALSNQVGDVTRELQLAASLQQNLLPEPLLIPSIQAAGKYLPAQFLAGDSYDYHLINDDIFAFYVVDVAGHGIASALVSFAIQQHFNAKKSAYGNYERRQAPSMDQVVLDTLIELNATFCLHEIALQFFTIVYGQIDLRSGELCFSQAGHPAPLIHHASDGAVVEHGSGGFPAGMFVDSEFTVHQHQLQKNDRIVIYSDGVTDSEALSGEHYGVERLKTTIKQSSSLSVVQAANDIEKNLLEWQESSVFLDDVSLLVMDYKGHGVGQSS